MSPPTVQTNKKITLSVPGTTANLGPAYDICGIALSVAIHIEVQVGEKFELNLSGLGADQEEVKSPETNMVIQGCAKMFDELAVPLDKRPPLKWTIHSDVPTKAGCGSSSAAVVGGMVAAIGLCGLPLDHDLLLQQAARIEGHPDNAAPAIFGGFQLVFKETGGEEKFRTMRVPLPDTLKIVIFTPNKTMKASTAVNRGVVPTTLPMADVVHNLARTAVLIASLTTNSTEHLKHCVDEKFHQEARANDYPHFKACVKAVLESGLAPHAFMSGAGPSVGAFVFSAAAEAKVAELMEKAAASISVEGKARIMTVDQNRISLKSVDI